MRKLAFVFLILALLLSCSNSPEPMGTNHDEATHAEYEENLAIQQKWDDTYEATLMYIAGKVWNAAIDWYNDDSQEQPNIQGLTPKYRNAAEKNKDERIHYNYDFFFLELKGRMHEAFPELKDICADGEIEFHMSWTNRQGYDPYIMFTFRSEYEPRVKEEIHEPKYWPFPVRFDSFREPWEYDLQDQSKYYYFECDLNKKSYPKPTSKPPIKESLEYSGYYWQCTFFGLPYYIGED